MRFAIAIAPLNFKRTFSKFSITIYRHCQGRSDKYSAARSHVLQQEQYLPERSKLTIYISVLEALPTEGCLNRLSGEWGKNTIHT